MFTAIVLDYASQNACIQRAIELGILPVGHPAKCHHVTLNLGPAKDKNKLGSIRGLTVTHFGQIEGRVVAFAVSGAHDSKNVSPHVTVATFGDARPKESNEIREWFALKPFPIFGEVREVRD